MQRGFIVSSSEPRLLAYSAIIEFLTGNFAEGRAYLARLADLIRASLLGPTLECGYFLVAAALARRATDVPEFTAISREIEKAILAAPSATTALLYLARTGLSLFATQDLDTAGARSLYEDFNGERGENLSVVFTIPALHVRGLLAGTMGRPDLAVGHFEDAIAFCEKAGYLPDLAWTYCDYADLLLQRDGPGDHAKAAGLLDLALKISTELGMRPLMERVIARRDILKA